MDRKREEEQERERERESVCVKRETENGKREEAT